MTAEQAPLTTGPRPRQRERAPLPILIPALVAVVFLLIPLVGLVVRAPWAALPNLLGDPAVRSALWLSLWTATTTTAIAFVLGVPLAWVLARLTFPGARLLRALVFVPLVIPPVVGGVALLLAFGRQGVVGHWLYSWFGITVPFTPAAVILAQLFVAMPFLVIAVEGALRAGGTRYDEVATTLGASGWTTFRRVTVPMVAPAITAGAVLCWARALGEFGATITFAGSLPGRTQTTPVAVYAALETDPDAALALSLILLVTSVAVLVALRGRWLRGMNP